ncbi:hypothetical protein FACS189437_08900 [Bacteroidia bacterium]|nr:hypothetical protein FACS189437_08900 [Bacteroidia bacterium]
MRELLVLEKQNIMILALVKIRSPDNLLNLPERIQFAYGHNTKYSYDASGMKHRVVHTSVNSNLNVQMGQTATPASGQESNVLITDYVGNIVYENNKLKYILNPEGYVTTNSANKYRFNYYLKDHLGNNRVVMEIDNSNSLVMQTTDYYPFGMPYSNGEFPERQPYKFGGKELDEVHGLNWYDFEARQLSMSIPRFTTMDPLAEKYYSVSPYAYVLNNPLKYVDPTGKTPEERLAAIAKILEYIGNSYSTMDCSETVDRAIRESTDLGTFKRGKGVDREDGNGKWANGVALIVSNSREVETNDMEVGNTVIFKSGRSDHKGEDGKFDRIGMVTNITRGKDDDITSFDFVHSSSKGVKEQTYNMGNGLSGFELKGVQAWDTPEIQTINGGTLPTVTVVGTAPNPRQIPQVNIPPFVPTPIPINI